MTDLRAEEVGLEADGRTARLRVEGTAGLAEGFARKVLFERGAERPPLELLLCRVGGRLHALHSLCPHAGGRLAEGPLREGRWASCPLHLYRFDPRTGAALEVECPPATTYAVEEDAAGATIRGPFSPAEPSGEPGEESGGESER